MDTVEFILTKGPALQDTTVPIDKLEVHLHGDKYDIVQLLLDAMEHQPKVVDMLSSAVVIHFQQHDKLHEFLQEAKIAGAIMTPGSGPGP